MTGDIPTIMTSAYASNCVSVLDDVGWGAALIPPNPFMQSASPKSVLQSSTLEMYRQIADAKKDQTIMPMRIVKVFIADPNENLPLDDRLLFKGDEKLTDATNQELFFEVPMAELLAKHNALRITTLDKAASSKAGRDVLLEPVKIRDLKMTIVDVAMF